MSRPLQDESFEALERRLAEAKTDPARLRALLHELSFRTGPREALLKERAEALRIQLAITKAAEESAARVRTARDGATRETADAAAANRAFYPGTPPAQRDMHKDFPGFDPGPMLNEMSTIRGVMSADESWRKPNRHLAVLALSILGVVALASAHLSGAFVPESSAGAVQVYPSPTQAREVAQLPYLPMGVSSENAAGELGASAGTGGIAGVALAGAGPQPNRPGVVRPVGRINLTTDLANMYAGEGPQIARAAVAAAGLGLNETVRWRNEKSGRHGTVTLIAQNAQRTACYTARITRLDTKTPQRRTQQLCF